MTKIMCQGLILIVHMDIFVKDVAGITHKIEVDPSDTIAMVRAKLDQKDVPMFQPETKNRFLLFNGQQLEEAQCSKIRKKCNFKSAKKHYVHFQKWQKLNFGTRKKFKTTKIVIFGLKKKQ